MSKKVIGILVLGLLVVAGVVYFMQVSDKSLKDMVLPELQVAHVQLKSLTADEAVMRLNVIIDNPAPVGISLDSLYYEIFIDGHEIAKTTYPDPLDIEGGDTTSISLPLTIYYDKLQSLLDELEKENRDSAVYKIDATIFSDSEVIPEGKLDLEVDKKMPLIRTPEVKITKMNIEDVGFSGATIVSEISITNKNTVAYAFKNMDYSLTLGDNDPLKGSQEEMAEIPAKGEGTFKISSKLDLGEAGKSLIDLIREGGDLNYELEMDADLIAEAEIIQNSKINMVASGNLEELQEVVEE